MSKAPNYSGKPRDLSDGKSWFYEGPRGLLVVAELRPQRKYLGTTQTTIPWRKVCAAVDNHRKIRASRKRKLRRRSPA